MTVHYSHLAPSWVYDKYWLERCRRCRGCNYAKVREDDISIEYRCRGCRITRLVYKTAEVIN